MGLQHYTQDTSRIPLKNHTNVLFYTKYTHPRLICRGTDTRTDAQMHGQTDGRTENIYSIFRDKLLLLGEHVLTCITIYFWAHSKFMHMNLYQYARQNMTLTLELGLYVMFIASLDLQEIPLLK